MRVTLDWDDREAFEHNFTRAVEVAEEFWTLDLSSRGELIDSDAGPTFLDGDVPDGSHFTAYGNPVSVEGAFNLRDALGDDETRLKLDRMRWDNGSPHLQVLYDRKFIDRTEDPYPQEDPQTWESGQSGQTIGGTQIVPDAHRIKDAKTGRLLYHRIARLLVERDHFDSGAALFRKVMQRKNVDWSGRASARYYDVKEARKDWVLGNSKNQTHRAVKKALRDYAEDRGLGHYLGGRAANAVYESELKDRTKRRTLIEYVDIVWDDSEPEERGPEDDYFRELNVQTSTVNDNNTNMQLKVTHDQVVGEAMDRLNPTSPKNNVTLEHQRARANEVNQAAAEPPSRNPDSMNWEERLLDSEEADNYLDNLPMPLDDWRREAAEKNPLFEVSLFEKGNEGYIWHVIGIDTGDTLRDATILKDSRGWW